MIGQENSETDINPNERQARHHFNLGGLKSAISFASCLQRQNTASNKIQLMLYAWYLSKTSTENVVCDATTTLAEKMLIERPQMFDARIPPVENVRRVFSKGKTP